MGGAAFAEGAAIAATVVATAGALPQVRRTLAMRVAVPAVWTRAFPILTTLGCAQRNQVSEESLISASG